ncbi:carbohydrate-binding module family 35 protein [Macrolepiota fuliginosa MF-IS2]|uniref:Alpha-galactosidase n=1 Tax=Macrolepiota fuliginosa MF-IS2 TaxID=1400762 RepID=A0A9P6C4G0_9AGAR|nr:carbohydrate-binding module family 35 protein [Macrolepiota fuliginosa MF-IS2]
MISSLSVYLALFLGTLAVALDNGLAKTPPMGWNPYNAFLCSTTEQQYHTAAQNLISLGLSGLGYQYVNLDCGWQGKARNSSGGFTWDTTTIPSGIPALSSFIHGLGLKFGVYSDGGFFACDFVGGTAHYLGSLGFETSDANSFASWGADYLKYDNCYAVSTTDFVDFNPPFQTETHYTTMRDALLATGRPIVFSICEWGVQDPARWPASAVGHSWRISNDIGPPASWDNLFRIINQVVPITQFAGPGGWNDLDMLEVGNSGLTLAEQQSHFVFWAAAKSPLIISTDLTKVSTNSLNILKNQRIIALNQDSLGKSISFRRRYTNDHDVWAGPLSDGSTVAVILNWQNSTRSVTFDLTDVGFRSATASDLFSGKSLGTLTSSYTATVDAHGIIVLKLSGTASASQPSFTFYDAAASGNTLAGGASTRSVSSSITVVGFVGNGGTLTINNVDGGVSGGTKLLSIDYINADFVFTNTDCSNCRNAFISINGGAPIQAQMPISGQSWDILFSGYLVSLSGFKAGKTNSIEISNPSGWTPDFYRIGVSN